MTFLATQPVEERQSEQRLALGPGLVPVGGPAPLEGLGAATGEGIGRGLASIGAAAVEFSNTVDPFNVDTAAKLLGLEDEHQARQSEVTRAVRAAVASYRPDPQTTGIAGDVVYGVGSILVPAIAGATVAGPLGGAAVAGAATGAGTYADLLGEGVDPATAQGAAAIEGTITGLSVLLPASLGTRASVRMATGAGLNVLAGGAERASMHAWLADKGYDELAGRYQVMDARALAIDAVLGAAFGVLPGARAPHVEQVDAALTLNSVRQAELDSAPGVPATAAALNAHLAALDEASAALLAGEPVRVRPDPDGLVARPEAIPEAEALIERALVEAGYPELQGEVARLEAELAAARSVDAPEPLPARRAQAESEIVNPIDRKASSAEKLAQLRALTEQNKPLVDEFLAKLDRELGTVSKSNVKKDEAILAKASRPTIRQAKPWHDVEHLRDSFRFKTEFNRAEDMVEIAQRMVDQGWEIVKVDYNKMLQPKEWGWRFVALDLRMPNGQLVEYYASFGDVIRANHDHGHALFEQWRNRDPDTMTPEELRAAQAAMLESRQMYDQALQTALVKAGQDESALRASLASFAAVASSRGSKSASSPSVNPAPLVQAPSTLRAANPSSITNTRLPSVEASGFIASSPGPVGADSILAQNGFKVRGATSNVVTERGLSLPVRWAVLPVKALVTSHDSALNPNPAYPAELQPRDRTRAASETQIAGIAKAINPELLVESPKASDGAPIVGLDKVVESGNARSIALRRAYAAHAADAYRAYLIENAGRFGLDPAQVAAIKRPVLVRVALADHNRAEFARQANESSVARMSASEQALADVKRLPDLGGLLTNEDGTINVRASAKFIHDFMRDAASATERGELVTADGDLSQAGLQRIRNAVFAAAYGDAEVIGLMAESLDANVKNVLAGMLRAAPGMARLRAMIAEGGRYGPDPVPDLVLAVRKFAQLRRDGVSVAQWAAQGEIFGTGLPGRAADLLLTVSENANAPKRTAEFLQRLVDVVDSLGDPRQADLIGKPVLDASAALDLAAQASRTPEAPAPKAGALFNAAGRPPEDAAQASLESSAATVAAEAPAMTVATDTGTVGAAGALEAADVAVKAAKRDGRAFEIAANCFLRNGS